MHVSKPYCGDSCERKVDQLQVSLPIEKRTVVKQVGIDEEILIVMIEFFTIHVNIDVEGFNTEDKPKDCCYKDDVEYLDY